MSKSKYYKINPNFKIQNLTFGFCLPAQAGIYFGFGSIWIWDLTELN